MAADERITLAELQREGLEAYREFHEAVTGAALGAVFAKMEQQAAVATREELAAALPEPSPAMPLRVLVSLAASARAGPLENFYTSPPSRFGDNPASEPLRNWLEAHRDQLDALFPELGVGFGGLEPWRDWTEPPGSAPTDADRVDWDLLRQRGLELAAAQRSPTSRANGLFYVLVRDWHLDLAPLLAEADVLLDAVLWSARELEPSERRSPSSPATPITEVAEEIDRLERAEQGLALELGLPTSSWTIFLAFTAVQVPSLEGLAEQLPSNERISAGIRALVERGEPSGTRAGSGRRPSRSISRDFWVDEDTLGHGIYADAIVEFIRHADTRPPLTIGIKAEWGAGKTSLMRMVRKQLDPHPNQPLPWLGVDGDTVTIREVLESVRKPPEERGPRDPVPAADTGDQRPTVWFNAWKYQSAQQIWAGLGFEIIKQLTARMGRAQRETFWAKLNLARIDADRVRREIYGALFDRLLSSRAAISAVAVTLTAAIVAFLLPAAWGAGLFLGTGALSAGLVRSKVKGFLGEDVSGVYARIVREPDYEGELGLLHVIHGDMERVLALMATEERPVVVFIDDLDRCSWEVVSKVVEAINLFLAGDFPNCIFVIAMEPDVVAAHIESAYADLTEALAGGLVGEDGPPLGWKFLEKMVQLPLSLPPPEPTQLEHYIASILGQEPKAEHSSPQESAALAHELRERQPAFDDLAAVALEMSPDDDVLRPDLARVVLQTVGDRFTEDDAEVRALIARHAKDFSENPREIKRFINVFRFYAFIQVCRQLAGLSSPSFEQVAKLAVLAVRWPNLLALFGRPHIGGGTLIAELERLADAARQGDGDWADSVGVPERYKPQLRSVRLREILGDPPPVGDSASGFL